MERVSDLTNAESHTQPNSQIGANGFVYPESGEDLHHFR